MIKAHNLTKIYKQGKNEEIVFKNLNFEAQKGKFTIIQGKSGSGKTTLLNMISTIDELNKDAKLFIDKTPIHTFNEHQRAKFRAKKIGFIFQSFALIPEFNILENCSIPLTMNGVKKKEALKKSKEVIKKLIPEANENFFFKTPNELSGGQQQRIAIARALIHNPPIIIADEPTANLDEESAKIVKEWLKQQALNGKCVIVVTHENDYQNYADVIYQFQPDETKKAKSKIVCIKKAGIKL